MSTFMLCAVFFIFLTLTFSALILPAVASKPASGRIGVLAPRGAVQCLKKWQATAAYLSAAIPEVVFSIVPLAFDEVDHAAAAKRIDFILTNPSQYVELELHHRVTRIATMRNRLMGKGYTRFGGVLFTREKSPLNTMEELRGKTLAAADEESLGGWLTTRREIHDHLGGMDALGKVLFVNTHDKVVEAVLSGKAEAGTVRTDTLERMQEEGKVDLRFIKVLHPQGETLEEKHFPFRLSTRLYPEWPMAKLPATPDETARKVAAALFEMEPDSRAAIDARIAGWTVPLNYQPVHDLLRELKVGPYKDHGKVSLLEAARRLSLELGVLFVFLIITAGFALHNSRMNTRLEQSRAEAERELSVRRQEETRRKDVENMVRHELRTPLISIISGINYFNNSDNLTTDQNRVLSMIRTWADKTLKVIVLNQALAKMERGTFRPMREPVDLRRIIREAAQESHEMAESKDVSVRIRFSNGNNGHTENSGDPLLLDIMISNIIRNAVEASPLHEEVRVVLETGPPSVIRVQNKGVIPEDIRETFFEKYVTRGKKSGTGLGTYTSRLIARSHDGDISMATSEEDGTEIRITLPDDETLQKAK